MVCVRCKMAVESVLEKLNISYIRVELGQAELTDTLSTEQLEELNSSLQHYELELIDNKKMIIVERIKILVTEMIHSDSIDPPLKFTVHLSKQLGYDYTYLSNLFSEYEDSTIERFYITTRIERVKELMIYERMSIKEVAYKLNYSSVSHLCLQFKKVTGQTPSEFRKLTRQPDYTWRKM